MNSRDASIKYVHIIRFFIHISFMA